jgi:ABC-type polysaccharide/polyol phosphate transport system ATPase subunit
VALVDRARDRTADRLAIVVEDLHEIFRIYHERPPGLKERLYRFRRSRYNEFHALDGVSLEVRHGETVALIGHNGSGKSTLLKCIAKILPADRGRVTVNGRVATLLELGAGFHEELSGRENIYLNGAILGLSRAEIDASFDAIVDFAGIRDFLDTPVRNYSSGMYVRLGFAIAVHVDPDILLVDEVLSVGDAGFQERSLERMRSFSQRGKTVVLVSHDLGAVANLCERTIVLDHGRIVFDGPTDEAIETYQQIMRTGAVPSAPHAEEEAGRVGDFRARITDLHLEVPAADVRVRGGAGVAAGPVPTGASARLTVEVTPLEDLVGEGGLAVGVEVRRPDVAPVLYETRTSWRVTYLAPPPAGSPFTVTFDLDVPLLTGSYLLDVLVGSAETAALHDRWSRALELVVDGPQHDMGVAALDARISVHNPDGVWPAESLPPPLEEGGPTYHERRDGPRDAQAAAAAEDEAPAAGTSEDPAEGPAHPDDVASPPRGGR